MTRDDKGRFVKGQSGNPGGQRQGAAALLRDALARKLTQAEANEIIDRLIMQAKRGDAKAREHLFAMAGIDLKTVTVKGDSDQPLKVVIEYVRAADQTP